jgi:Na+/H+ antiporter NhaD/arsenite permease-like protein
LVFFRTGQALSAGTNGNLVAGVDPMILMGISLGAVFMGSMTYIGNGPNFMVRAIAESSGVKMPSFFGYMVYSCVILLPIFWLMMWQYLLFPY